MANANLAAARAAKNDEFYTQHHDIEAELAARYERDVYEYLAVAYPGEDPRQLRMLASNVVKGLTGRAGQWGNQQNDR